MKKFFAVAAVAGMAVLASCGNAEELAKKLQDSIDAAVKADSIKSANAADSTHKADSIAAEETKAKAAADSAAKVAHDDSVAKGLIKEKK